MGKRRNQNDSTNVAVQKQLDDSTPSKRKRIENSDEQVDNDFNEITDPIDSKQLTNGDVAEKKSRVSRSRKNSTVDKPAAKQTKSKKQKITPVKESAKKSATKEKKKSTTVKPSKAKQNLIIDNKEDSEPNDNELLNGDEDLEDVEVDFELESESNKSIKKFDFDQFVESTSKDQEAELSEQEEEKIVEKKVTKKGRTKKAEQTVKDQEAELSRVEEQEEEEVVEKKVTKKGRAKKAEQVIEEKKEIKKSKKQPIDQEIKSPKPSTSKATATSKPLSATKKSKASKEKPVENTVVIKKPAKQNRKTKQSDLSDDDESSKVDSTTKSDVKKTVTKKSKANKKQKIEEEIHENDEEIGVDNKDDSEEEVEQKTVSKKETKKMSKKSEVDSLKITSFNVSGIRACVDKKGLVGFMLEHDADIYCFQELKCDEDKMPKKLKEIEGYNYYWNSSAVKSGYAGVAVFTKIEPINVTYDMNDSSRDGEGRVVTCEFDDFFLVNVYATNAGKNLVTLEEKRDWSSDFQQYLIKLDKKKPVIACGDFNCAHEEIDLENPKTNHKTAGFTPEEREDFTQLLASGFFDSYRHLYPDKKKAYTFWSYMKQAREKDIGWRLDYFLLSRRLEKALVDNIINKDVMGSDHCPITLTINI